MSAGHWLMRLPPDDDDYVAPIVVIVAVVALIALIALAALGGCALP